MVPKAAPGPTSKEAEEFRADLEAKTAAFHADNRGGVFHVVNGVRVHVSDLEKKPTPATSRPPSEG